jgi:hypothetical protein
MGMAERCNTLHDSRMRPDARSNSCNSSIVRATAWSPSFDFSLKRSMARRHSTPSNSLEYFSWGFFRDIEKVFLFQ